MTIILHELKKIYDNNFFLYYQLSKSSNPNFYFDNIIKYTFFFRTLSLNGNKKKIYGLMQASNLMALKFDLDNKYCFYIGKISEVVRNSPLTATIFVR